MYVSASRRMIDSREFHLVDVLISNTVFKHVTGLSKDVELNLFFYVINE